MLEAVLHGLVVRRERIRSLAAQLNAYHPLNVLARGYAVVRKEAGDVVLSVTQVTAGERLIIRVSDGEFTAHSD